MKVLHLLDFLGYGGTERVVWNLCRFGNVEKSIVLSLSDGDFRKELEAIGVPVVVSNNPADIIRLAKSVDVVNNHCLFMPERERLLKNIPHVITLHWCTKLPKLSCPIISVSEHVARLQHPDNCVVVINNGIDLSRFTIRRKNNKSVIITRVCRPSKCADYFWASMQATLRLLPNAQLWIVGEEGRSNNRIKYFGIRDDVPDILTETDIFAYTPYPNVGSFDLVVLEAMACGVPCVVSDVPCVNESVVDGFTGFLTQFGDVKGFAKRVYNLATDGQLRKHLSRNAASHVRKNYDILDKVKEYEKVYMEVLS